MRHMVYTILNCDIPLQYLETSIHHHTRWWIILCLFLPELPCLAIIFFSIEIQCLLIVEVDTPIRIIYSISDEFKDTDSFGFSLDGYGIEFTREIEWSEEILRCLRDDDMYIILLTRSFESGCEIHCIAEDSIVEAIMRSDIAHHHLTRRYTNTEVYRFHTMSYEIIVEARELVTHKYSSICCSYRMILIREWCPEESHNRISDILIECSSSLYKYICHM